MRISCFLLLIGCHYLFAANSYSQNKQFSFDVKNESLKNLFKQIEKESEFIFFYSGDVNVDQTVSICATNSTIIQLLDDVLKNTGYTYRIDDRQVFVKKTDSLTSQPLLPVIQQQAQRVEVKGVVVNNNKEPMVGVNIYHIVDGSPVGTTTDLEGNYSLFLNRGVEVNFRLIGYKAQTIRFTGNNANDFRVVTLYEDSKLLDEVQVVAFSTQKKESVVSSIATVNPAELKVPSSNLTTALAGRIAGLVSYQRSGEPGADNAEFFVRGVTSFGYSRSPLILIDGLELTTEDLARLNTDDIESFSILKDATSAALYGSRGANGVIIVTTKQGEEGRAKITFRIENSLSMPSSKVDVVDPISYMNLFNEAITTRNPLDRMRYSQKQIDNTIAGMNRNVYPATDWYGLLFSDYTNNQRYNMNISGGGNVAQYYIAANYNHDTGNLKVDKRNNYNQNININRVNVRSNININLTKITELAIRMNGSFEDYQGPVHDGTTIYNMIMKTSPVDYPAYFEPDEKHQFTKHILFGNNLQGNGLNPYAELVKGYRNYSRTFLSMQGELKQKLDFITEGLKFRLSMNTNRTSYYASSRQYSPYYYYVDSYDRHMDKYVLFNSNEETAKEYLGYSKGKEYTTNVVYLESAMSYARTFADKHDVSGLFVFTMRNESTSSASTLTTSLPYRNLGLAGRLTYGFDSRYFVEANFGYNASERFHQSHRWGFFPSMGLGWMLSNEHFFQDVNKDVLSQLKFKATYGLVGNDQIGDISDRFFYLSNVNLNAGTTPGFGLNMDSPGYRPLTSITRYGNNNIAWEVSKKLDLGVEFNLFNDFKVIADYFRENRSSILMTRASISDEMGLEVPDNVKANIGEAYSNGFDGSIDYNKAFSNGLWVQGRANFTYAVGKYSVYEESEYPDAPWLKHVNQPITQTWGYVAERLFIDENDIKNSPVQFGEYMAGDIKYKDINNDGVINFKDRVPIGHPASPEIVYGFGFSLGYKNFDLSAFFQGSARSSFWIDQGATAPFITSSLENHQVGNNTMLQAYADSYWSESNQNSYALWPRLSSYQIENNNQTSTWFMQDGSFLRLKSLEVGYSLDRKILRKLHMDRFRIYITGSNLFSFSKFKLWDAEMAGNGLGYPIQRVINIGLQCGF